MPAKVDGRRIRGERSRQLAAQRAAELASLVGLNGLSLGGLARELGLSKSGVAALYGSKQELQLAAVETATGIFAEQVIEPAQAAAPGLPRLNALVDAYLDYAGRPVFPGRCFMAATVTEFDSHPGPIRDALAAASRRWHGALTREVSSAQEAGQLTGLAADLVAFEIDAILSAASTSANLFNDPGALARARRILTYRLSLP